MDDLDFLHKITDKINSLTIHRERIIGNLMDGDWHTTEVKKAVDGALALVDNLDEPHQSEALRSVVLQMPGFIASLWKTSIDETRVIDLEKARWQEMEALYKEFLDEKKSSAIEKDRLAQAVKSGEVPEPSTRTGMRRKTGERPPITLKDFRNFASKDAEQKTSSLDGS